MGFTLIGAGLAFLFNPNFNIIDIIPDFIGLILVYFGLMKLSHINEDIGTSQKMFLNLAAVDLLKLLSIGLISGTDNTWYLLLSFSFGVVECILFLYAISAFFTGIEHLGVKYNSEYVLKTYNSLDIEVNKRDPFSDNKKIINAQKIRKDVITRTKNTVIAFYFVRTLCSTLPEFTQIIKEDAYIDYTVFTPAFYILGALVTIIWSVFFLVRLVSFTRGIIKDKPFMASLGDAHGRFESMNTNYRTSRKMRLVFLLYSLAIAFTINVNDDGLARIPLIIPAVLIILASLIISLYNKKSLFALITAVPLSILSIYNYSAKKAFYTDSTKFMDIFHFEKYMDRFLPISNIALLEYCLLTASFILLTHALFKLSADHIEWDRSIQGMSEKRIVSLREERKAEHKMYVKLQYIFMLIVLIVNTLNVKLSLLAGSISSTGERDSLDFAAIFYQAEVMIIFVLTIVWFVHSRRMASFAKDEIYSIEYAWSTYEEYNE